jgi:hypothetical protein
MYQVPRAHMQKRSWSLFKAMEIIPALIATMHIIKEDSQ